jgi:uncharacterized membrane protein HdeD (DUF308 family)
MLSLVAAFTGSPKPIPTWWLVVVGLLGIAAGIVTFLWPGITAILLVMFIGAWALVRGIFEIIGAIQLRTPLSCAMIGWRYQKWLYEVPSKVRALPAERKCTFC